VTSREFQERLTQQARQVNLTISAHLADSLEVYFRLLVKWNRKINLTGLNLDNVEPAALDRLFIEPVLAAQDAPVHSGSMIDIGSGGGSPAIPMALALSPVELLMVEARSRKSVFLQEVIRELALNEARVANTRYETLLANLDLRDHFDLLTVRAVRLSPAALSGIQGFLKPGGRVMLFRSSTSEDAAWLPPLEHVKTLELVASQRSYIEVLEKSTV
jgi:16S rRNA (guanine527-N7)-methyltransferase